MASIAEILMAQGQTAAESRRARAGAWMPLIQTLSNLPGQVMADRVAEREAREAGFDRAQQRAVRGQQLESGKREAATAEAAAEQKRQMNEVLRTPGVMDPDQRMDARKAQEVAHAKGYTEIVDDILSLAQEHNAAINRGMREQTLFDQGQTDRRQATNKMEVQRKIGESIAGRGGEPISPADRQMYQGMALQAGVTLPAGVLPEPEEEVSMVVKGPNGRPTRVLVPKSQLRQGLGVEQYERPPQESPGPQPSYSWAIDPKTGKAVRATDAEIRAGGMGQPETAFMRNMDAGKGRATPLLESVVELADRINVNQGLYAKMAGGAAKVAAKANYDDDVAEYQAMVTAFTPLWARALGHVGILTQVDVDSAREALPKPGDSKTLMQRKIARIEKILGATITGSAASTTESGRDGTMTGPRPGAGVTITAIEEIP